MGEGMAIIIIMLIYIYTRVPVLKFSSSVQWQKLKRARLRGHAPRTDKIFKTLAARKLWPEKLSSESFCARTGTEKLTAVNPNPPSTTIRRFHVTGGHTRMHVHLRTYAYVRGIGTKRREQRSKFLEVLKVLAALPDPTNRTFVMDGRGADR